MVTPRQILKKLKSLDYRLRLAQDISSLEKDIIDLCQKYDTDVLSGYKVYIENGRIQLLEKLPDTCRQLEMRFKYGKAGKLEEKVKSPGIKKMRSYFDAQYHGCSIRLKVERKNYSDFNPTYLNSPSDAYYFLKKIGSEDRERFLSIFLDVKNAVIGLEEVSVGTLSCSLIHPREVFKAAILSNPVGIILAHNHPSGDPEPSKEDIEITKRLVKASKIMGIEILDHIIIGHDDYRSLKEEGKVQF